MRVKNKGDFKTIFGERIVPILVGLTIFSILGLSTVYVKLARAQFGYQPTIGSSQSDLRGVSAENTGYETPAHPSAPEFISNDLLIKVSRTAKGRMKENIADTGITSLTQALKAHNVQKFEQVNKEAPNSLKDHEVFRWYMITLNTPREKVAGQLNTVSKKLQMSTPNGKTQRSESAERAVQALQGVIDRISADPDIESVEPNYVIYPSVIPNDTYYSNLWGMTKIQAPEAWDITTGSPSIVIAIIDTGVNYNHPDLTQNIWINAGEIPANGLDDDNNGYVDDVHGVDTINYDSDPMDETGHGTHVAGTIGAHGNNALGVTGINWNVKIMPIRIMNSGGGTGAAMSMGLMYAANKGARISSNSYGGAYEAPPGSIEDDSLKYEHDRGMVVVVAAGNNNIDAMGFSPARSQYAITVGGTDSNDGKASWSNWGEKLDVVAPGVGIYSTVLGVPEYGYSSGTSMSTPHVSGLAALLLSTNPTLTNEQVRQIIRLSSDDIGAPGKDRDFGYGRINAFQTLSLSHEPVLAPFIISPRSNTVVTNQVVNVTGSANGSTFQRYRLEIAAGRAPTSWQLLNESTTPVTNGVLGTVNMSTYPVGGYLIRLSAIDTSNRVFESEVFDIYVANVSLTPTVTPYPTVTLTPTSTPQPTATPTSIPTPTSEPTPPLGVFLDSFTAQWINIRQVRAEWMTTFEINNRGFNIWRGVTSKGPTVKLNKTIILSCSPGGTQACSYSYTDTIPFALGSKTRPTYYYWLEDIDLNGAVTRYGPVGTDGSGGP